MLRLVAASRPAIRKSYVRTLIASDGVTDDDRKWWEWHIPTRQHQGNKTPVLYLDGVGRYTWKHLLERDVYTVEDCAQLTDDDVLALEREGCTYIGVAVEHAKVFMKTMKERERELSLQQSSWDKEVNRILKERDEEQQRVERNWAIANQALMAVWHTKHSPPPKKLTEFNSYPANHD